MKTRERGIAETSARTKLTDGGAAKHAHRMGEVSIARMRISETPHTRHEMYFDAAARYDVAKRTACSDTPPCCCGETYRQSDGSGVVLLAKCYRRIGSGR